VTAARVRHGCGGTRPHAALALGALALVIAAGGCKSKPMTPVEKGRLVYVTHCLICHNSDPNLAGTQGPPIAGSSRELITDRVLHLAYPPGYTPKRKTHAMRTFPHITPAQIDALAAYLAQAAAPKTHGH
jgi:mono/diheme cytochrome c family protein